MSLDYLLDAVIVLEFSGFTLSCVIWAFANRSADNLRWWLLILGLALFLPPLFFLEPLKGDYDGFWVFAQFPLALLLLPPSAVAAGSSIAYFVASRKRSGGRVNQSAD